MRSERKKRWTLIGISVLILLVLFGRGVMLRLGEREESRESSGRMDLADGTQDPEGNSGSGGTSGLHEIEGTGGLGGTDSGESFGKPFSEGVIKNVWICSASGQAITFLSTEGEQELPLESELEEEQKGVIADLYVRDRAVYRISLKPERITGKVVLLDEEAGILELEEYDTLSLDEEVAVYDLRKADTKEGSSVTVGSLSQIVLGYDAADYVVADGVVCAVLICHEIVPEQIRVLIKTTGYEEVYHDTIRIRLLGAGTAQYDLASDGRDKVAEQSQKNLKKGTVLQFRPDCKYLQGGRCVLTAKKGIQIESIERGSASRNPVYAGRLEILQTEQGLLLINEVDLEEYVRGVLPSEMPATFPKEALQVQAVCARSYACRQLLEGGCRQYGAHVDDSTAYQVYQNAEGDEATNEAVKNTEGQILTWEKEAALTSYFSTSCGMTSPADRVWLGMEAIPYLTGAWQGEGEPVSVTGEEHQKERQNGGEASEKKKWDLSGEEAFRTFLLEEEGAYEAEVSWYRWKTEISLEHLQKNLDNTLLSCYRTTPALILTWRDGAFTSIPVDTVGRVEKIRILQREKEGLVTALEITGDQNRVQIYGEYNIRTVLAPCYDTIVRKDGSELSGNTMLPSAYLLIEENQEGSRLSGITIRGGGYGHGVGMSQYGAKALAESGMDYQGILSHYYPGTELEFLYQTE